MGLFDAFKQASAEGPGRVMKIQLEDAKQKIETLGLNLRRQVLQDFCQKRENLIPGIFNMTTEGLLKTGMDYQRAGNKLMRTAPIEGLPLLLVGMWLESRRRPGAAAEEVQDFLDSLAINLGGSSSVY